MKILGLDREIEDLGDVVVGNNVDLLQNADEDLLEALEVPVLVDASVDDTGIEHLLCLHGQEVEEVVHGVDLLIAAAAISEVMRQ